MKNTLKLIFVFCDCVAGMNVCTLVKSLEEGVPHPQELEFLVVGYKPSSMNAENQTWELCKSNRVL